MRILFYDPCAYKEYTLETGLQSPLGGSEATLIRVANALKAQHEILHWIPKFQEEWKGEKPDVVIIMRAPILANGIKKIFPEAKVLVWMHDIVTPEVAVEAMDNSKSIAAMICVSEYHKTQTVTALQAQHYNGEFPVARVFNPVDDDLQPDPTVEYDKNKLVFFSSPHKGLEHAIRIFDNLRANFLPDIWLDVLNPG